MKKDKKKKSSHSPITQLVTCIGLLILLVYWLKSSSPTGEMASSQSSQDAIKKRVLTYPEPELKRFWEEVLKPTADQLVAGKFPLKEVNDRFQVLDLSISIKYGMRVRPTVHYPYFTSHPDVMALSSSNDGIPKLAVSLSAFHNVYDKMKDFNDPRAMESIKNQLVLCIIHEMEHLHSNIVQTQPVTPESVREFHVKSEKYAWDKTCKYVLEPFTKNDYRFIGPDRATYENWVKAGRDVDSPLWDAFIRKLYAHLLDK